MAGTYTKGRENIMVALYALLTPLGPTSIGGNNTFLTMSRKLVTWDKVPPEQQPALFLADYTEFPDPSLLGLDDKNTMRPKIFIYAAVDQYTIGSTVLNNLLDAVAAAMAPRDPSINVQNLGGLVNRVWFKGEPIKDPGDLDGQAVALLPIEILVPGTKAFPN